MPTLLSSSLMLPPMLLLRLFVVVFVVVVVVVAKEVCSGEGLNNRFLGKMFATQIDFFSVRALQSETGSNFSIRSPIATQHRFSVISRFKLEMSMLTITVT